MENDLLNGFVVQPSELEKHYQQKNIWDEKPIWELVTRNAKLYPQRCAVSDESCQLSYAELVDKADSIAAGLLAQRFRQGERAVLQWSNQASFVIVLLGLFRAGLVPVLTLPGHRYSEISHLTKLSGASVYISSSNEDLDEQRKMLVLLNDPNNKLRKVYSSTGSSLFQQLPQAQHQDFVPPSVNPSEPALFLVSGGTTGLPKLIPRSHNDYRYNIHCASKVCKLNHDDIYLAVLPAAHNFPLGCPGILGILDNAGQVVFTQNASPDHCFDLIESYGITVTALVPALAQVWAAATAWEESDLSSLRLLQVGGSKLCESDARAVIAAFPNTLQQVFGMAEGLVCYTRNEDTIDTIATTQGSPMSPLDELRVVDEDGQEVSKEGELLIRGPYTLRGYYRAQEHNRHAFTSDGFYRSGDRVRIGAEGNIIVTGRIKDVVNRGGEMIACDEIEAHLLTHPNIQQAAVLALPDQALGELIGAAIVSTGKAPTLKILREFLTLKGLAAFKLPERLQVLSKLPITAVGKIDKKQIIKLEDGSWRKI